MSFHDATYAEVRERWNDCEEILRSMPEHLIELAHEYAGSSLTRGVFLYELTRREEAKRRGIQ